MTEQSGTGTLKQLVTIAILIIAQTATVIWWAASLSSEVKFNREVTAIEHGKLKEADIENRKVIERMQRMEDRMNGFDGKNGYGPQRKGVIP